jgi:metal-sulfur cluster biosynthetic enzyme
VNVDSNSGLKGLVALAALQNVYDPEIGLNVVDLGLIYRIDFFEEIKKVYCKMTLTTEFCPMGESITNGVKDELQKAFSEYSVEIDLTFEPAWNYERISEEGRSFLGR